MNILKIPKLTPRLSLVAEFISEDRSFFQKTVADVGTDHAKLPIYLIATNAVNKAYASDLREGPLKKARENIAFYLGNESGGISVILGNGTENIPPDYNYLSITGMGGELISSIIEASELPDGAVLVLSPMTGAETLRKYLYDNGYDVAREALAREDDRIYTVIKVRKNNSSVSYTKIDEYFSKALLTENDGCLKEYIRKYVNKTKAALDGRRRSGKIYGDEESLEKLLEEMTDLEEKL